jgi:hypothetical protein
MSNAGFQRHFGPRLMMDMAKYYRVFGDAVPAAWKDLDPSEWLNLVVDFRSDEQTVLASSLQDEKAVKEMMLSVQEGIASRGNLILPDKV